MTQRENLLHLFRRESYEFAPCEFLLCPSLVERYKKETNSAVDYQDYFNFAWRRMPWLIANDTNLERFHKYHTVITDATVIDEWGVGHVSTPTSMHMTQMLFPLGNATSVEDILNYPMPSYSEKSNPDLKAEAEAIHARGFASVGNMQCTIWESAWYMRGMENLMMDMMSEDPMADALLDRVTEISLSRAILYANAGVDILFLGDDIGMQSSIMMSEQLYCDWLKPRLKHIISEVKKIRPDIIICYHTCGFVEPLIPHLIEAGVDVLNPVQPECMDFAEIYAKYSDKLCFNGTIGTQTTMPFGTPEDVRREVFKNLDIARNGGLFVSPTHLLEPEVPWENIVAYVNACKEYEVKHGQ